MRKSLKIGAVHLVGVGLLGAALILGTIALTGDAWRMIHDDQLGHDTLMAFIRQLGAAAIGWLVLATLLQLARRAHRSMTEAPRHRVVASRGTALIETLIAMPIVFLLSFGLAQFALNNVTAIMMNYATFTASRAAWVWEAEGDLDEAAERARVAGTVSLTPVAYGGRLAPAEAESRTLMESRGMMVAAQYPTTDANMGSTGVDEGRTLARESTRDRAAMSMILGQNSFKARTAQQMTAAYRSTIAEVEQQGDSIQTTLRYQHLIAMPLVGQVFGEYGVVQGKVGYWMLFERSYTRDRMTPSNRNLDDLVGTDMTPRLL